MADRWLRLGSTLGVSLAVLAGVSSGCGSDDAPADTYHAGGGGSGGSGGSTVDPTLCTGAECKPPPCCGQSCTAGSCCNGTVCSTSGKCVPDSCEYCGDLGCVVDATKCTGECNKPSCCLDTCTDDSQCCSGTRCSPNTDGVLKCFPKSCDACSGMTPICHTSPDCGITCVAPSSCGELCTGDAECGSSSFCNTFLSGVKKCVPKAYQDECNACGSAGCTFYGSTCTVECKVTGTGGTGGTGGSGGSGGVAGAPSGGGQSGNSGAGGSPMDSGAGGSGGSSACGACCQPCAVDGDCCPGNVCGTKKQCVPSMCRDCEYGCTFYCPA